MAKSTVPNRPNPHELFAEAERALTPTCYTKSQPEFRVFPTGEAEHHWRVADLFTTRTISLHKNLTLALSRCTWLNKQRGKGASNETK